MANLNDMPTRNEWENDEKKRKRNFTIAIVVVLLGFLAYLSVDYIPAGYVSNTTMLNEKYRTELFDTINVTSSDFVNHRIYLRYQIRVDKSIDNVADLALINEDYDLFFKMEILNPFESAIKLKAMTFNYYGSAVDGSKRFNEQLYSAIQSVYDIKKSSNNVVVVENVIYEIERDANFNEKLQKELVILAEMKMYKMLAEKADSVAKLKKKAKNP